MDLNKFRAQLENNEGKRRFAYLDTRGKITVGIGRNLTDVGLSEDEIAYLYKNDLDRVLSEVAGQPWWCVVQGDDVRSRAILDMVFELGLVGFSQFKKAIFSTMNKDWDKAAENFQDSLWAQQVPGRAARIISMIKTGEDA